MTKQNYRSLRKGDVIEATDQVHEYEHQTKEHSYDSVKAELVGQAYDPLETRFSIHRPVGADYQPPELDHMVPFDRGDWECYAGCEGDDPKIGFVETDSHHFTLIADTGFLQVLTFEKSDDFSTDQNVYNYDCEVEMGELIGNGLMKSGKFENFHHELISLGFDQIC